MNEYKGQKKTIELTREVDTKDGKPPEFTAEDALAVMREDARKLADVAEIISNNRDAFVLLLQRQFSIPVPDGVAMKLTNALFHALCDFSSNMTDALARADAGEMDIETKVVRASDLHDGDGTTH